MSMPSQPLPWPENAPAVPLAQARPVLDRLASLAARFPRDLELVPGLAQADGEITADPPHSIEQVVDELGGVRRHGAAELDLLLEERADVGPYTLMGSATTFYPIYESGEMAVILTIGADGSAGAVYGIGEDLALQLAGRDLVDYLGRLADALETVLAGLDERVRAERGADRVDDEDARAEVAEQALEEVLYRDVLGMRHLDEFPEVALVDPETAGITDLPPGTLAVADLRDAPLGARVDVIDADLPGDPLDRHLEWRANGLVVCIVQD